MCMCVHMCVNTTGCQRPTWGVLPKDVKLIFNNFIYLCLCVHNVCTVIISWSHLFPTSPSYSSQIRPPPSLESSFLFFQNALSPIGADHDVWLPIGTCLTSQRPYPVYSLLRTHQPSVAPEGWGLLTPHCSGMLADVPCVGNHGCCELCMQRPCCVQKTSLHSGLPKLLAFTTLPCSPQGLWAFEGVMEMLHLCPSSLLGLILCT